MSEFERILYIEDEPDIREIAQIALESVGGFQVRVCASGKEALAAVGDFAPHLILLDVMMPEMDGPTTLAELRKLPEAAHIPAVFMTARVQPGELAHYKEMGALGVVKKPFDPMTLPQSLRDLWEGS